MIRLISTVILAFTAFTAQAAQEHIEFKTPAECQAVWTGFHTQTTELGLTRYEHQGQSYFVKDGYVGYWSAGNDCNGAGKLTMEPVAEFKERMSAKNKAPATAKADEPFCSTTTCKVLVGTVAVVVTIAAIRALGTGSVGCVLPSDRASDGSRCGARASSVRPGGK
jgi:hypothetical protein